MIDSVFYEKVIKPEGKGKLLLIRVISVALFVVFSAVWVISSFVAGRNPALIFLILVVFSVILFIVFMKTGFEYEYSISDTEITLSKIYQKRRRKEIFALDADNILYIAPKSESNLKKCEEFKITARYDIYSPNTDEKIWMIVFENKKEERVLFSFEADDSAAKLLKMIKPSVMYFK